MFNNYLSHGGPGSGRYPKGSGENPRAGRRSFRKRIKSEPLSAEEKTRIVKEAAANKAYRNAIAENSKTKHAKDIVDNTSNLVREAKKISDESIRNGVKKEKLDLSKMTDKEMRDKINRQLLENQYNQLFAPEKSTVTKGQQRVNDILTVAGGVLAVGSSALGIALSIKKLKE